MNQESPSEALLDSGGVSKTTTPAQLTKISTLPNLATVSSNKRSRSATLLTSAPIATAFPPACSISLTAASALSALWE